MSELYKNNKGLKEKHKKEQPLFEKTYTPPSYGDKMVSRLYRDGSLYFLSPQKTWAVISVLTSEGLDEMNIVLAKCYQLKTRHVRDGNIQGSVSWKLFPENEMKEIFVVGIPDKGFDAFQKINHILNTKMQTIPSG